MSGQSVRDDRGTAWRPANKGLLLAEGCCLHEQQRLLQRTVFSERVPVIDAGTVKVALFPAAGSHASGVGVTKQSLQDELILKLTQELEVLERAYRATLEGAVHEEAKPENDKDRELSSRPTSRAGKRNGWRRYERVGGRSRDVDASFRRWVARRARCACDSR